MDKYRRKETAMCTRVKFRQMILRMVSRPWARGQCRETTGADRQQSVTLKKVEALTYERCFIKCENLEALIAYFFISRLQWWRWERGLGVELVAGVSSQTLLYELHTPMRTCRDTRAVSVEIRWELQINTQPQSACVWRIAAHRKLFTEPITPCG